MSCNTRPHQAAPDSTSSTRQMTRQHQTAAPGSSTKQMSHLQAATLSLMLVVDILTKQLEKQVYTYPSLK